MQCGRAGSDLSKWFQNSTLTARESLGSGLIVNSYPPLPASKPVVAPAKLSHSTHALSPKGTLSTHGPLKLPLCHVIRERARTQRDALGPLPLPDPVPGRPLFKQLIVLSVTGQKHGGKTAAKHLPNPCWLA
jgi:hypothetical protein